MKIKPRNPVFPILLGVLFLILSIPTMYTFLFSIKDYNPLLGLHNSDSVGFSNFEVLFSNPYFYRIFNNTVVISSIALVSGSLYTFFASMAIGGMKNRWLKSVIGVLFAVAALLPATFAHCFIPEEALITGEGYRTAVGIMNGLKLAGLVSLTAIFTKDDVLKQGLKTTLLFIALMLVTFFSPDTSITISSVIYGFADTWPSFIYRSGFINSDYSFSAAVSYTVMLFQFVLAIPTIFLLIFVMRQEKKVKPHQPLFALFSISGIFPVIILISAIVMCSSLIPSGAPIGISYITSFIISLNSALIVGLFAYVIALLARNSGIVGVIVLTILCAFSANSISEFMLMHSFGLLDTHIAVILSSLRLLPMMAILYTFATKDNRSFKKDVAVFITIMFAVFAITWGDFNPAQLYIRSREKYTIALNMRELMMNFPDDISNSPMSTAPFLLIPIIIAFGGSMLTALLNKTKVAVPVQQSSKAYSQQIPFNQQTADIPVAPVIVAPVEEVVPVEEVAPIEEVIPQPAAVPAAEPAPMQETDLSAELRKYKALLDEGLITEEDYNVKKAEILNR